MTDLPDTPFWRQYNGRFFGLLKSSAMDELWVQLAAAPDHWYIFDFEKSPPSEPIPSNEFSALLLQIKHFLQERKFNDHGGLVYVDDLTSPNFIKIFDPRKMGSSCGGSGGRVFPRWTISKIAPDEAVPQEVEAAPKSIFAKLIGASEFR